jgi:hypothetical protein
VRRRRSSASTAAVMDAAEIAIERADDAGAG